MSRVAAKRSPRCQHRDRAGDFRVTNTDSVSEGVEENWYFWSQQTATRRDHYGSESITTVYAVKTAIAQKRCEGRSLLSALTEDFRRIVKYQFVVFSSHVMRCIVRVCQH